MEADWGVMQPPYGTQVDWQHPMTRNLIADLPYYWPTAVPGPARIVGTSAGQAFSFRAGGIALTPSIMLPAGPFTYMFRCDLSDLTTNQYLSDDSRSTTVIFGYIDGAFEFYAWNRTNSALAVTRGIHTGCYTYDGSTLVKYLDGVPRGAYSTSGPKAGILNRIGCSSNPIDWFRGSLISYRIWSRGLSAEEVAGLHARPYSYFRRLTGRRVFAPISISSEIPMYLFQRGIYRPTDSNIRRF